MPTYDEVEPGSEVGDQNHGPLVDQRAPGVGPGDIDTRKHREQGSQEGSPRGIEDVVRKAGELQIAPAKQAAVLEESPGFDELEELEVVVGGGGGNSSQER